MSVGECAFCDEKIHFKAERFRIYGLTNTESDSILEFCSKDHLVLFFVKGHYNEFKELNVLGLVNENE